MAMPKRIPGKTDARPHADWPTRIETRWKAVPAADRNTIQKIAHTRNEGPDQTLRVDSPAERINGRALSTGVQTWPEQHGRLRRIVKRGHEGRDLAALIVLRWIVI